MDFEKKLATTRSRGINIFMIFQNIAQLKNRYDNDVWQEILGNADKERGKILTGKIIAIEVEKMKEDNITCAIIDFKGIK